MTNPHRLQKRPCVVVTSGAQGWLLDFQPASRVSLGNQWNLSEPQFPHL